VPYVCFSRRSRMSTNLLNFATKSLSKGKRLSVTVRVLIKRSHRPSKRKRSAERPDSIRFSWDI
jgi:hypothetical protein